MNLLENFSLLKHNTFGIDVSAKFFFEFNNINQLIKFLKIKKIKSLNKFVIGGGSNLLFTQNYEGVIIHPQIKGIEIIEESNNYVLVKVGAGENWDNFVEYTIKKSWGGLENLSFIPGNVGASPVQNIGAYGVEAKDIIEKVDTININNQSAKTFNNQECEFEYRESIFKTKYANQFIVTHVYFKLSKTNHIFKINYGNIEQELNKYKELTISNIRNSIINIRSSKLPDPKELGNAGSFFKNPIISIEQINLLQLNYPEIPKYFISKTEVKVPAGWLIEKCGWKGKQIGNTGVHKDQSLVLVNYNKASGNEILQLANLIIDSVYKTFNILLQMEVIIK